MELFKGCCPAIVTPFTQNGKKINFKTFAKLIDFQLENGISAIVFLGTTGESSTLTAEEKESVVKFAVEYVAGRVPVIVGAGSNDTAVAIRQSQLFEDLGADALLSVTPYYNKCTQKGLFQHFADIAGSVKLPILLYNVPGRTAVNLLAATVKKLSAIPNIVGIKEASGNLTQTAEIIAGCGPEFSVYSGDDELTFATLALGGKGVISVVGNVLPQKMSELCAEFFAGNLEKSRMIQFELNPLIKALFYEVNPIPVKKALSLLGFKTQALRLPLTKMEPQNAKKLALELRKLVQ